MQQIDKPLWVYGVNQIFPRNEKPGKLIFSTRRDNWDTVAIVIEADAAGRPKLSVNPALEMDALARQFIEMIKTQLPDCGYVAAGIDIPARPDTM